MSWWEEALRGIFAVPTGGMSEVIGRNNQLGRTVTGGLEGAGGGFLTGGPIGAGMGAATGAGLSGTGTTDPYKLKGGAINFGAGGGAGGLGALGSSMFGSAGGAGSYGAAGMSAPNMGAAGSTLGAGGMGSPLSLGGYGGGSAGVGGASAAGPSATMKALQLVRMMPQGGGQQGQAPASQQADVLQRLYQMFPSLKPGANMGQGMRMGGM